MIGRMHGAPRGKRPPPLFANAGSGRHGMDVRPAFIRRGLADGLR